MTPLFCFNFCLSLHCFKCVQSGLQSVPHVLTSDAQGWPPLAIASDDVLFSNICLPLQTTRTRHKRIAGPSPTTPTRTSAVIASEAEWASEGWTVCRVSRDRTSKQVMCCQSWWRACPKRQLMAHMSAIRRITWHWTSRWSRWWSRRHRATWMAWTASTALVTRCTRGRPRARSPRTCPVLSKWSPDFPVLVWALPLWMTPTPRPMAWPPLWPTTRAHLRATRGSVSTNPTHGE